MSTSINFFKIERLIELGRFHEAERSLVEALQDDPDHAELKILAARLQYEKKEFKQALNTIQECLASDPNDDEALLLRFQILNEMEQYADAERDIIDLLQQYPLRGPLWASYALLMLKTGHTKKAGSLSQEAMRLDPEDSFCLLIYCVVQLVQGSDQKVASALEELISKNPEYEPTLMLLVASLTQSHRKKEAFALAKQLVQMNPRSISAVDAAKDLALHNHWSMKPFWIFNRFGWAGSIGLWVAFVALIGLLEKSENSSLLSPLTYGYLGFCLASWVWPPLLKKWIHHKGFRS
ncbi:MAG TPA: tetratricopeptide repeat protein [Oligoflexus sp.]|uniref:tetratricopeptide repeat protein n=1 Tax=Oligoflexus sp. TaxID=1971216 RepID=UPI002D4BC36C|nr:tetratricopeptide repeat protein [Oligoflexus sp.]HYX36744.1 tetratricopeptide repeat protein [Oligoflexus sp.]